MTEDIAAAVSSRAVANTGRELIRVIMLACGVLGFGIGSQVLPRTAPKPDRFVATLIGAGVGGLLGWPLGRAAVRRFDRSLEARAARDRLERESSPEHRRAVAEAARVRSLPIEAARAEATAALQRADGLEGEPHRDSVAVPPEVGSEARALFESFAVIRLTDDDGHGPELHAADIAPYAPPKRAAPPTGALSGPLWTIGRTESGVIVLNQPTGQVAIIESSDEPSPPDDALSLAPSRAAPSIWHALLILRASASA